MVDTSTEGINTKSPEPGVYVPHRFFLMRAGELATIKFPYDYEREREKEIIRQLNEAMLKEE